MKKLLSLALAVLMLASILTLSACGDTIDPELDVRIMVLNGTTGFGMAKLISDDENDLTELDYDISVETDASNITYALLNGEVDIAALPTNAASVVYNRSEGGVQILAINTLGVLYLLSNGETVTDFESLRGKTIYAPAQNPTFILKALCEANGLTVGTDVFIDNSYAQPADLRTAVAAGKVSLAVLPEPMVTIATSANKSLTVALDLTEEWDKVYEPGSLVQGCVVVRTEFAEQNPAEVAKFLEDYEASIQFLTTNTAEAAKMIVEAGIFANEAVAAKAIPNCNVTYLDGKDMKAAMAKFLEIMHTVAPASIGNAIPANNFYYTK
ncbi:MAG: ABC transporter substrate-binding protein [Clostridia bacterium]|nr:ABC transporter substrate-binding protein [Clostridia bacterium]